MRLLTMMAALMIAAPVVAQDKPAAPSGLIDIPHLPEKDASAKQTLNAGGRTLNYTATAGKIPVRDEKGRVIAEVAFTSYILDGARSPDRPVTIAFNGGPGAASVYLDLGLVGPKRVSFGGQGDTPSSAPPRVVDNAETWLDFTDLVFIDPVGTGFSRHFVTTAEAKSAFFGTEQDIRYLSRVVYDWLLKNKRLGSPKYLVGESYGGFRLPRIAYTLTTDLGVGIWGMTLVSPRLDYPSAQRDDLSPMAWISTLPSMAAAKREADGALLKASDMVDVENYARTEFAVDLLAGARNPAALDRLSSRVAQYTGLDPALVRRMGGRIDLQTFAREYGRSKGVLASRYDVNVTAFDPFPWSPSNRAGDPILEGIIAPTTSAKVDQVTRIIGWPVEGRYDALSDYVSRNWERDRSAEATTALRQVMALDPKLKVLVVHGFTDVQTPYFGSRLIIDQIPTLAAADQIRLALYPGGHMFYSRPDSRRMMRTDVRSIYR